MGRSMRVFLLILAVGSAAATEALAIGPSVPTIPYETLGFEQKNAPTPTFRADAEIRLIFGRGWSLPALPGTKKAIDRERNPFVSDSSRRLSAQMELSAPAPAPAMVTNPWFPIPEAPRRPEPVSRSLDGGRFGLFFRGYIDVSHRGIDTYDQVDDRARVNSTDFLGEGVKGSFEFMRNQGGLRAGFCTRFLGLSAAVDFFGMKLGVRGDLLGMGMSGQSASLNENPGGSGTGFSLECSPFPWTPKVQFYFRYTMWDAGDWTGNDSEYGLRVRFAGFSVFGGYRTEEYERNVGSDESRIEVRIQGIVFGLGVSF